MPKPENQTKNLKNILIVAGLVIVCLAMIIISARNRPKSAYTVAYYDVPDIVATEISNALESKFVGGIKYLAWDDSHTPSKKQLKEIDLVVTWDGAKAEACKNKKYEIIPLLRDGFELNTLQSNGKFFNISIPTTLQEFYQYTEQAKSFSQYPLYVNANEPKNLLGLLGAYTAAVCGADGYKKLVETIKEERSIPLLQNQVLDKDSSGNDVTIGMILEDLRKMYEDGILTKESFTFTDEDELKALKKRQIYADAKFLSDFRLIDETYTAYYNTSLFPVDQDLKVIGITAPTIVVVQTSKRKITPKVLAYLQEGRIQEYLSYQTGLAPVANDIQGVDTAADDIHYYASTTLGGALTDLYHACFKNRSEAEPFADQVREYISSDLSHIQ